MLLYSNHKKLFGHVLRKWTMAYLQKIGAWHPWLCATANYSEKVCAKALETNLKGGLATFILQNAGVDRRLKRIGLSWREDCWSLFSHPGRARDNNVHCYQIKQTGVSKAQSWHAYRWDGNPHLKSNPSRWHYMYSVSVAWACMADGRGEVKTLQQPCWRGT